MGSDYEDACESIDEADNGHKEKIVEKPKLKQDDVEEIGVEKVDEEVDLEQQDPITIILLLQQELRNVLEDREKMFVLYENEIKKYQGLLKKMEESVLNRESRIIELEEINTELLNRNSRSSNYSIDRKSRRKSQSSNINVNTNNNNNNNNNNSIIDPDVSFEDLTRRSSGSMVNSFNNNTNASMTRRSRYSYEMVDAELDNDDDDYDDFSRNSFTSQLHSLNNSISPNVKDRHEFITESRKNRKYSNSSRRLSLEVTVGNNNANDNNIIDNNARYPSTRMNSNLNSTIKNKENVNNNITTHDRNRNSNNDKSISARKEIDKTINNNTNNVRSGWLSKVPLNNKISPSQLNSSLTNSNRSMRRLNSRKVNTDLDLIDDDDSNIESHTQLSRSANTKTDRIAAKLRAR